MQDMPSSIKSFLNDRAVSPLFGAYIVSLLAWNFRVVMVIFSNQVVEAKFRLITKLLTTQFWGQSTDTALWGMAADWTPLTIKLTNLFVVPILIALFYLFVYPVFAYPVFKATLWIQGQFRTAKKTATGKVMLSLPESIALIQRNEELEEKITSDANKHRMEKKVFIDRIAELEGELSARSGAISQTLPGLKSGKPEQLPDTQEKAETAMDEHSDSSEPEHLPDSEDTLSPSDAKNFLHKLSDSAVTILVEFEKHGESTLDQIAQISNLDIQQTDNAAQELVHFGLITEGEQNYYSLTPKWKRILRDIPDTLDTESVFDGGTFGDNKESGLVSRVTGATSPPLTKTLIMEREVLSLFPTDRPPSPVTVSTVSKAQHINFDTAYRYLMDMVAKNYISAESEKPDDAPVFYIKNKGRQLISKSTP